MSEQVLRSLCREFANGPCNDPSRTLLLADYISSLSDLTLQNLRRLAGSIGLPAHTWSRTRCIAELVDSFSRAAEAGGEVSDRAGSPNQHPRDELCNARRLRLAVLFLLQNNAYHEEVNPNIPARLAAAQLGVDGTILERLWLLALATRRKVVHRRSAVTTATPRKGNASLKKGIEKSAIKRLENARSVLASAAESGVSNRFEMEIALAGRPWLAAELCRYEDVSDSAESSDDDHTPVVEVAEGVSDKKFHDLDRAIRMLPGGRTSPPGNRRQIRQDILNLLVSLRQTPRELSLADAMELLRDKRCNELGFEVHVCAPSVDGVETSLFPSKAVVARAMRRSESLLWLQDSPSSMSFDQTAENEVTRLCEISESSRICIPKFTCRLLVNIYGSVDALTEDPAELADVFEILGSAVQAELLGELLGRQKADLLSKMYAPDECIARTLIYWYRTARRVLSATTDELRHAFGEDSRAGYDAAVAVHGNAGALLPWLLPVLPRAHAAAASLLRRFGSTKQVQDAHLREILTLRFHGATPLARLELYHAIHRADWGGSLESTLRFKGTQRAWDAMRGRVRCMDALDACGRVMERFDGKFEAARAASVAQLAECLTDNDVVVAMEIQDAFRSVA
jgi:hypothetical protein